MKIHLERDQATEDEIKDRYAGWDFDRPPFSYEDGSDLTQREQQIFSACFPLPPEGLDAAHPLNELYNGILKAKTSLGDTLGVKESYTVIKKTRQEIHALGLQDGKDEDIVTLSTDLSEYKRLFKRAMREHFDQKKLYLQKSMAYLLAYSKCNKVSPEGKEEAETMFHFTELVYLGHEIYPTVRSIIHQGKPLRESGDIVMDHVYKVAVNRISQMFKRLKKSDSMEEKREIFLDAKIDVVVGLLHDTPEDTSMILDEVVDKARSMVAFDGAVTEKLRNRLKNHPDFEKLPESLNFISQHFEAIKGDLASLQKHENKEERLAHMIKVLNTQRRVEQKMADRAHNISTLKYMKAKDGKQDRKGESPFERQLRKIEETVELLKIAGKILARENKYGDLPEQIVELSLACQSELNRLETDPQYEEMRTDEMMAQIIHVNLLFLETISVSQDTELITRDGSLVEQKSLEDADTLKDVAHGLDSEDLDGSLDVPGQQNGGNGFPVSPPHKNGDPV